MHSVGYDYVIEIDNYTHTLTLHGADTACRPPRLSFLGNLISRWSGNYREPSTWTMRVSKDDAFSAINGFNEARIRAFGGVLSPYKFVECRCAR